VGPHRDGRRATGTGQERAIHVVLERGRRHLRDVKAGMQPIQLGFKGCPAHPRGDRIDDRHTLVGKQRRQLRQIRLWPDHPLARSAPHPVLAANPDAPIGRGRVDEQDIHGALRAFGKFRPQQGIGVREIRYDEFLLDQGSSET